MQYQQKRYSKYSLTAITDDHFIFEYKIKSSGWYVFQNPHSDKEIFINTDRKNFDNAITLYRNEKKVVWCEEEETIVFHATTSTNIVIVYYGNRKPVFFSVGDIISIDNIDTNIALIEKRVKLQPYSIPSFFTFYGQVIPNVPITLVNGTTTYYILTEKLIDNATRDKVDFTPSATFTNTVEALVQTLRFFVAQKRLQDTAIFGDTLIKVIVGCKGDGTYATTLSKIVLTLEKLNSAGAYTTIKSITITPTALSNTTTTYSDITIQGILEAINNIVSKDDDIVLKVDVYGYVAAGSTGGQTRVVHTTGGEDIIMHLSINEV